MIEVGGTGLIAGRKVKAMQATEEGCKTCTFLDICARHSYTNEFKNAIWVHLDCMAKYRFDNISVHFVNAKKYD